MSASILCPAKINLTLKIVGRRPDGFHFLESAFVPLNFGDTLNIEEASFTEVGYQSLQGEPLKIQGDTVSKAFQCLKALGIGLPDFKILVQKKIPMGAGLGGSSTNAGTFLKFLISSKHIDQETAHQVAQKIGADVSFFLNPVPTWIWGIGEKTSPLACPQLHLVLVKPPSSISSKDAYIWWDEKNPLASTLPHPPAPQFKTYVTRFENELEPEVASRFPEIAEIKSNLLKLGAQAAFMTGSGSAVVGIFPTPDHGTKVKSRLADRYPRTYWIHNCSTLL